MPALMCRTRLSFTQIVILTIAMLTIAGYLYYTQNTMRPQLSASQANERRSAGTLTQGVGYASRDTGAEKAKEIVVSSTKAKKKVDSSAKAKETAKDKLVRSEEKGRLERLGVLSKMDNGIWIPLVCDRSRKLRNVTVKTKVGDLSFYVYDSASRDGSVTAMALSGTFFEKDEIDKFMEVSRELPLIDVGGNVGLVSLQAAMQGRQVVVVEPIPENALRLCRSVLDFGHESLVHVIQNAVSSSEGNVTLAMDSPRVVTHYEVSRSKGWGHGKVDVYSIFLDRLLDILPFKKAVLKIDVESHEGHVIAKGKRLFQEIDIPMVWMEWGHMKDRPKYGGPFFLQFMERLHMEPYDLMSGKMLDKAKAMTDWPFTVLWRRADNPS